MKRVPTVFLWVAVMATLNTAEDMSLAHDVIPLNDVEMLQDSVVMKEGGSITSDTIVAQALEGQGLVSDEAAQVAGNISVADLQRNAVPDSVQCFWKLTENKLSLEASLATKRSAADVAHDEFTKASARNQTATSQEAELQNQQMATQSELEDARNQYKTLHEEALKLFYTAKGDLDNYKNERKKVDLDSAQSKSALSMYLKYKKSYIEAAADAEDSTGTEANGEVDHYKKLAEQYLGKYHEVQEQMKTSYSDAKRHQTNYFQMSKDYHKMTEDANDMARKAEQLKDTLDKTAEALEKHRMQSAIDAEALPGLTAENTEKGLAAEAEQGQYDTAKEEADTAKLKYFTWLAMVDQLKKMGNEEHGIGERNQLRFLELTSIKEDKNAQLEATIKHAMVLKNKAEAANSTAVVFMKSYHLANCDRVLASADHESAQASEGQLKTVTECQSDKHISEANKDASDRAKSEHMDELNHLALIRQEHNDAATNAAKLKAVRDAARSKAERFQDAAADIERKTPC